jgi:two-component system, chemotaxis family, protein-glutamate methylesterase/glutaminase
VHAKDGDHIEHRRIYVCPPNFHLLLERGMIRLSRGPQENGHRPAIDPLFRSAARVYGDRVVGVLLSGVLDDGSEGLLSIKLAGGETVVQDPEDALYPAMPKNAIDHVRPEFVVPVAQIPDILRNLAASPPDGRGATLAPNEPMSGEPGSTDPQPGAPSGFTCPDCGGALWESDESGLLRFRCRIGHEYAVASLMSSQGEALETALWGALRALEERAGLNRRLAERAGLQGRRPTHTSRFEQRAVEADRHAGVLRDVLQNLETVREVEADPADTADG